MLTCFQCISQPIGLAWILDVHVQSNTSHLLRERAHLNWHRWSEHCMLEKRAVDAEPTSGPDLWFVPSGVRELRGRHSTQS